MSDEETYSRRLVPQEGFTPIYPAKRKRPQIIDVPPLHGPIRRVMSFIFALLVFAGSFIFLFFQLFISTKIWVWPTAGSGMILFAACYWLWQDFIRPRYDI